MSSVFPKSYTASLTVALELGFTVNRYVDPEKKLMGDA
jgi:hypothetical protein